MTSKMVRGASERGGGGGGSGGSGGSGSGEDFTKRRAISATSTYVCIPLGLLYLHHPKYNDTVAPHNTDSRGFPADRRRGEIGASATFPDWITHRNMSQKVSEANTVHAYKSMIPKVKPSLGRHVESDTLKVSAGGGEVEHPLCELRIYDTRRREERADLPAVAASNSRACTMSSWNP